MEGDQGGRSAYQTFDKGRCKSLCISRICFKKREREREREIEIEREKERKRREKKKEKEIDR